MEQTDSDQREAGTGIVVERRGRDSQRTCMNDPRTWEMVWGLNVGVAGQGWARRGKN